MPVFRRDVLWYGDVCDVWPSVRPSGSPSVRLSVRPSVRVSVRQFSTFFSNMLWHIELKFCIWLCFTVLLRSSSSVVNLRQVLYELCPFWNLEYWKYTVSAFFFQHALTYWAEILHMTLFYCTTDQVRVLTTCVNFCLSYAPFGTQNTKNTQFSALFSYMLWHIELKCCTWICFTEKQIKFKFRQFASISVGVMPLLKLRILEIQFSALFSNMLWHMELKFFIWLCLMYYRSSLSVVTLCPSILSEI